MAMLSSIGRSAFLAALEGMTGVLYIAITVASAGQCLQAAVGFALNSVKMSAIIV
jgi:hypothetical protein